MNFIIFLCVTLKLFHLTFMPLLAPNPGDATARLANSLFNSVTEQRRCCTGTVIPYRYSSCCWCCRDDPLQKSLRLRRFKSDRDEMWQDFSPRKYAVIDRVGFSIWRHTFKRQWPRCHFTRRKVLPSGECTRSVRSAPVAAYDVGASANWLLAILSSVPNPLIWLLSAAA